MPFRTWRNNITEEASEKLTDLFGFHIPQRWTIAHLYQAILNGEPHVADIDYVTTLAGYIQWKMTGERVVGVGEASGIFPIDSETNTYFADMIAKFDEAVADKAYSWKALDVLPHVLTAGDNAGVLTKEGAALLDMSGNLEAGIPLCPPEGYGSNKQRPRQNRKRVCRNFRFCYDRSGEEPFQSIPGDRYGNNPVRSSGCHGALPELYF